MSPRLARYRAAALVLTVAGLVVCIAALAPVSSGMGLGVGLALSGGSLLGAAVPGTGRGPRLAVSVLGVLGGAVVLTSVRTVDQHDRPPATIAALLVVVAAVLSHRSATAKDIDAITVAGTGLAVVGASAAVGTAAVAPLVLAAGALVVALALRTRAHHGHEPARPQPFPWRPLGVGVTVVALAALAAPVPRTAGLHASLFKHRGGGAPSATTGTVSPDAFDQTTLDLGIRGSLSHEPVMAVSAAAPELWRGGIYADYDGSQWHRSGTPVLQRVQGPTIAVTVRPASAAQAFGLYAPGYAQAVTGGSLRSGLLGAAQVVGLQHGAYREQVVPIPAVADAVPAGTAPDGWLQLPDTVPARVGALARLITSAAPTEAGKVAAVETYLRDHERYTLAAPVPRAGHDAVDDFLFVSHQGFCEQFASAEVVLLRSVGIPARLVTGFGYGTVSGPTRTFAAADAHAWVEVAVGATWATSDPTAGSVPAGATRSWWSQVTAATSAVLHDPVRRAAAVGVVVVLVLLGTGVRVAVRRRRRPEPPRGPVARAFAGLEARWPRPPASTPREWARTLPVDLSAAVAVWEAEQFAATAPTPPEVAAAVAAVTAAREADAHAPR